MPKVKIKAHELTDGDVEWISIVKRGANQVPFRVLKHEEGSIDMLNLKGFFLKHSPVVAAVAVRKGADLDKIKPGLEKAGYKLDKVIEQESATLFMQSEIQKFDGQVVIQHGDDVGIVVVGADRARVHKAFEESKKMFMGSSNSTDFDENQATAGFYPGVEGAMHALMSTLSAVLGEAKTQDEAVKMFGEATDKFRSYVVSLAESLPMEAFKLDFQKEDEVTQNDESKTPDPGKTEEKKETETVKEPDKAVKEPDKTAKSTEDIVKEALAMLEVNLAKQFTEATTKAVADLKASIAGVETAQKALAERVTKAEETLATQREKLKGTIFAFPTPDRVAKGEDEGESYVPYIDTARDRVVE